MKPMVRCGFWALLCALAASVAVLGCQSPETTGPARTLDRPAPVAQPLAQATAPVARSGFTSRTGASRPNVIVIVADDLGYADVSTYHPGRIPTPHIDRIGREGAVFTRGYASAPICSPARAGLMTGRHQQRFGFEYNTGPAPVDLAQRRGLAPGELTLADAMRAAGYRTAAIGKWHLGSSPEHYPLQRGFDEFWGFLTGQTNFIRHDAPQAVNALPPTATFTDLVRPWMAVGEANAIVTGPQRQRVPLGDGFLTEQITEQAVGFIERNRSQPFFLYLAHNAPHTPLQVTQRYFDRFPHIADRSQRVYAGMVSALDDGVGAVLDRLKALGLDHNTIVIFVSDNGCAAYVPGLCSDQPLSGGKLTVLEGGVRIPYLVRWPARIAAGSRHTSPVSTLDLMPTLAAAAGVGLPGDRAYDGSDLLPQLAAAAVTSATAKRAPLFWRSLPIQAMQLDNWKYVRDLRGQEWIYDLAIDPRETRNLASSEEARLVTLRNSYRDWEATMGRPRWEPARTVDFEFGGRSFQFRP